MTIREMKEKIIAALRTLPVCIPYKQETQYLVRCFSCGDSSDPTHAHLSIAIDVESNESMVYRCFKCPFSGLVTVSFLEELGVPLDEETKEALNLFNKKLGKINRFNDKATKNFYIPELTEDQLLMIGNAKIEYLADRLGVSADVIRQHQSDFRLILNPFVVLNANGVKTIPGVSFKQLQFLNYNYIGFLVANSNVMVFRRIKDDDSMKRYINITINPKIISSNTFFKLPGQFDLLYTNTMHIRVAEGIMDILSIFLNVMNEEKTNNLYFGCCGFRFISIIKYLITNGINTGIYLHIYSDNDKTDDNHKEYLRKNTKYLFWIDKIFIHRNTFPGEKDFGVPKEKIKEIEYELKI